MAKKYFINLEIKGIKMNILFKSCLQQVCSPERTWEGTTDKAAWNSPAPCRTWKRKSWEGKGKSCQAAGKAPRATACWGWNRPDWGRQQPLDKCSLLYWTCRYFRRSQRQHQPLRLWMPESCPRRFLRDKVPYRYALQATSPEWGKQEIWCRQGSEGLFWSQRRMEETEVRRVWAHHWKRYWGTCSGSQGKDQCIPSLETE